MFLLLALFCFGVFAYYYVQYDRIISKKMSGQIFSTSAKIYARPVAVHPGDKFSPAQIATMLRHAGYVDADNKADFADGHIPDDLGRHRSSSRARSPITRLMGRGF